MPPSSTPAAPPVAPALRATSSRISARTSPPPKSAAPPPASPAAREEDALALEDIMEPASARPVSGAELADEIGLRPRLKLTPTATDAEFSAVFEAAGGPPKPAEADAEPDADGSEEWTWKDLLASIDGAEAEGERLQDLLAAELDRLGVEPGKLLPKARIDEIAGAVQTGDTDGARQVVKRLAPAAVRRITRRLGVDGGVKRQALTYVRRYQTLIQDAVVRDPEGFLMAGMLAEEGGRLFLLLDAAAAEL
jgi:hypothetical protein